VYCDFEVAKKAKTPRPPVQAPKRRETKPSGPGGLPRWVIPVGAAVLAAIVVGVVFAMSGGDDGDGSSGTNAEVKAAMTAAGCTYRDVKPRPPAAGVGGGGFHADSPTLTSKVKWSTFPPSSGGHYSQWAPWGFYRTPQNPRQVVHNLEHGGVVMWWGPKVPTATIDDMERFYRESEDGMFGTPIAGFDSKIALTAWTGDPAKYYRNGDYGIGHIAVCTKFDEDAFKAFRDAFRGKGPEGIKTSQNKRGT
jgi:hypothetical protein